MGFMYISKLSAVKTQVRKAIPIHREFIATGYIATR